MKRKILYINIKYSQGGAGIIANSIYNSIKDTFDAAFIYGYGKNGKKDYQAAKPNIHMLGKYLYIIANMLSYKLFGKDLFTFNKSLLENEIKKADIVHIHAIHSHFVSFKYIISLLLKYNKKVVWTFHDSWAFTGRCALPLNCQGYLNSCKKCLINNNYPTVIIKNNERIFKEKQFLFQKIPSKNLKIVCPSNWLKNEVKRTFLSKFEVTTINNGIDTDIFNFRKKKEDNELNILFISNYISDSIKGANFFFKIVEKFQDIKFNAIGHVDKNCNKYPNLNYLGYISDRNELIKQFHKNDVMVFFSKYDNYPTVIIEALSCGLPVISFKGKGNQEIFDGIDYPLLIENDDFDATCNIITSIVRKELNLDYISLIGRHQVVKNNNINKMIEKYHELYNRFI